MSTHKKMFIDYVMIAVGFFFTLLGLGLLFYAWGSDFNDILVTLGGVFFVVGGIFSMTRWGRRFIDGIGDLFGPGW